MSTDTIVRLDATELFSEAVTHQGVLYVSGQVALDHRGNDVLLQVEEILARLDGLLAAGSSSRTQILTSRVILSSSLHLAIFNEAWSEWLPAGCAPTRTTWVAQLTSPDFDVEVEITAAALG